MLCGWQYLNDEQRARVADGIAQGRVLGGPFHIELHPTNQCPLNCFFCYCKECRHGETLPYEIMERLLREEAGRGDLRALRLSGGGESLLHPQINKLVELIGSLGVRIADLTTNATRLEGVADALVAAGLDYAMISLNECDPGRYARMMGVTPRIYDQALRGIEALRRARDAAPPGRRPVIEIQYMVWRENYGRLAEMAAAGRALGADRIVLKTARFLQPEARIPESAFEEVKAQVSALTAEDGHGGGVLHFDLGAEPELNRHAWEERRKLPPRAGSDDPEFVAHNPRRHYCYMGWIGTLVAANGLVYPCCPLYGVPGKELGSIHEEPLAAIWRGERYARFRREIGALRAVRGDLEFSRRLHKTLEPVCIQEYGCLFGYHLCDEGFYEQSAARAETETPPLRRLGARAVNSLVRAAHRRGRQSQ